MHHDLHALLSGVLCLLFAAACGSAANVPMLASPLSGKIEAKATRPGGGVMTLHGTFEVCLAGVNQCPI